MRIGNYLITGEFAMWFYLLCTVAVVALVAFFIQFFRLADKMGKDERESNERLGK